MKPKILILLLLVTAFMLPDLSVQASSNSSENVIEINYPDCNPDAPIPEKPHLTKSSGVFAGPSGTEKYYNLPMGGCITEMRNMGYTVEEYPYYIREDGAKMLGKYVMCAADISWRPKGTILETSLGTAIVVDTGSFRYSDSNMLDMCVDW